jgi:hypothetical protein
MPNLDLLQQLDEGPQALCRPSLVCKRSWWKQNYRRSERLYSWDETVSIPVKWTAGCRLAKTNSKVVAAHVEAQAQGECGRFKAWCRRVLGEVLQRGSLGYMVTNGGADGGSKASEDVQQ